MLIVKGIILALLIYVSIGLIVQNINAAIYKLKMSFTLQTIMIAFLSALLYVL